MNQKRRYSVRDCSDVEQLATDSALLAAEARQRHWTIVDTLLMQVVCWDEWDAYGSRPLLIHETPAFDEQCRVEAAPHAFAGSSAVSLQEWQDTPSHIVLPDSEAGGAFERLRYAISQSRASIIGVLSFMAVISAVALCGLFVWQDISPEPAPSAFPSAVAVLELAAFLGVVAYLMLIFLGYGVYQALAELQPLDERGMKDLNDLATRYPQISEWLDPAVLAGHTLRERDRTAAEAVQRAVHQELHGAPPELGARRSTNICSSLSKIPQ